jgi:hypothetical protein
MNESKKKKKEKKETSVGIGVILFSLSLSLSFRFVAWHGTFLDPFSIISHPSLPTPAGPFLLFPPFFFFTSHCRQRHPWLAGFSRVRIGSKNDSDSGDSGE